ncbi:TrmH family RNA methyltransferase [Roseiflexus castenholzii]|uniref:TrmH family RNA methyltransferase n=1 Tax=Roseiflexus castenholzii TaxID=120962 RepID=UPI003C7ED6C4
MITSPANQHVKRIRSLAADRQERRRERMFVLEGVRLVADALESGATLTLVLYAPEQLQQTPAGLDLLQRLQCLPVGYAATPQVIASVADTVHPQGVVALARWPQILPGKPGLILVIDAVQDPGNLGTLLRSAEAVGVAQTLCSVGTVDVYAPKVVRSAMGAHFRLSIEQDVRWDEIGERLAYVDHVYAADPHARMPYYAADWRQPSALLVGNEAHGLSEAARRLATKPITIPMRGRAESLNVAVAASVILFEALRQRTLGRG